MRLTLAVTEADKLTWQLRGDIQLHEMAAEVMSGCCLRHAVRLSSAAVALRRAAARCASAVCAPRGARCSSCAGSSRFQDQGSRGDLARDLAGPGFQDRSARLPRGLAVSADSRDAPRSSPVAWRGRQMVSADLRGSPTTLPRELRGETRNSRLAESPSVVR